MIYTYKVHAEVIAIAAKNIETARKEKGEHFDEDEAVNMIRKRILNLYDTEEHVSAIFKLLCESCNGSYTYSDDVFTIICYFMNNLLEVRPTTVQNKLMVLFEKRAYSQKFFEQIYNYLNSHCHKLNSGNFIHVYANDTATVSSACYLVDENRERQMLRLIALMCSRLNYKMKDYMAHQKYSDQSFGLVQTVIDNCRSLIPYMHYQVTYDTLKECLGTILEFVDGDSRSDHNTQKVVEEGVVSICAGILDLHFFESSVSNQEDILDPLLRVIEHNFTAIKSCSEEISWIENSTHVLSWMKNEFKNERVSPQARSNEFALLPHDGEKVQKIRANFRITLLKQKVLEVILELTNSGDLVTKNAFLTIYSELDPVILRKNYIFQSEMFKGYHKEKYRTGLLNRGMIDPEKITQSGFIIEIGYLIFYVLIKIHEFQLKHRSDRRYRKQIMRLMPEEVRNDVPFSQNTFVQFTELCEDTYKRIKRSWSGSSINFEKSLNKINNDVLVSKYMKFYADTTSQIEILDDGKLIPYTFILLPYCRLASDEQKEEFLQKLDRTSPQVKCESLMQESKFLIKEMKTDYLLKNNSTEVGKILLKYNVLWKTLFISIIWAINFIILVSYNAKHGDRFKDPKLFGLPVTATKAIMLILGIILLILWVLICVPVIINEVLMVIYKYDNERLRKNKSEGFIQRGNELQETATTYSKYIYHNTIKLFKIMTDVVIIYMLLLGISIILGITWTPFFYAFLVTYVIVQSPQMNNLLKAIWEPKVALAATIVLMLLLFYMLVILAYYAFENYYPDNDCFSMWT